MSVDQKPTIKRRWRYFTRRHAILASLIVGGVALVIILLVLTAIALVLARLVPAVPSSIWVLALATIASATFLPIGPFIASTTQNINVLFAGLPMIALIGMSLGRDVKALRSLSWKIIIVALMTFTASFVAAAVIAQVAFHF